MVKKVVQFVSFAGSSTAANKTVKLSFKSKYSDLVNTVKCLQLLNNDITLTVKLPEDNSKILGRSFRLNKVNIDHDGESKLEFISMTDFVELDNLGILAVNEPYKILLKADIEEEADDAG